MSAHPSSESRRAKRPRRSGNAARRATRPAPRWSAGTECVIANAESLKSQLCQLLPAAAPVTLDLSALQRVDTAGLQLLAAFVRERVAQGREVRTLGAAPGVLAAAALLGLGPLLERDAPQGGLAAP
jgi:ABC-type transporter Mla MlaB component